MHNTRNLKYQFFDYKITLGNLHHEHSKVILFRILLALKIFNKQTQIRLRFGIVNLINMHLRLKIFSEQHNVFTLMSNNCINQTKSEC